VKKYSFFFAVCLSFILFAPHAWAKYIVDWDTCEVVKDIGFVSPDCLNNVPDIPSVVMPGDIYEKPDLHSATQSCQIANNQLVKDYIKHKVGSTKTMCLDGDCAFPVSLEAGNDVVWKAVSNMKFLLCTIDRINEHIGGPANRSNFCDHVLSTETATNGATVIEGIEKLVECKPKFFVKLEDVPSGGFFHFTISAKGEFCIDWGDREAEGEEWNGITVIKKTDTEERMYSRTYRVPGNYTVGIGGGATAYNLSSSTPAISFARNHNYVGWWQNNCNTDTRMRDICGDLGRLFPILGTTNAEIPSFYQTFYCNALRKIPGTLFESVIGTGKSSMFAYTFGNLGQNYGWNFPPPTLPNRLFASITGAPASGMFSGTFSQARLSGEIPEDLFAGLDGPPADSVFSSTFWNVYGLTGIIPKDLFKGIKGAPASSMFSGTFAYTGFTGIGGALFAGINGVPANSMFSSTFYHATGLTGSIPPGLFGTFTGSAASSMFSQTFWNCQGLTGSIPANLFAGINGAPADSMFYETFRNCRGLTSENSQPYALPPLFSGVNGMPASSMYYGTFVGCSGLTGTIPHNIFGTLFGSPASYMFLGTFSGARNITGKVPGNLFSNIIGPPAEGMFASTFANTNITSIGAGLFDGIQNWTSVHTCSSYDGGSNCSKHNERYVNPYREYDYCYYNNEGFFDSDHNVCHTAWSSSGYLYALENGAYIPCNYNYNNIIKTNNGLDCYSDFMNNGFVFNGYMCYDLGYHEYLSVNGNHYCEDHPEGTFSTNGNIPCYQPWSFYFSTDGDYNCWKVSDWLSIDGNHPCYPSYFDIVNNWSCSYYSYSNPPYYCSGYYDNGSWGGRYFTEDEVFQAYRCHDYNHGTDFVTNDVYYNENLMTCDTNVRDEFGNSITFDTTNVYYDENRKACEHYNEQGIWTSFYTTDWDYDWERKVCTYYNNNGSPINFTTTEVYQDYEIKICQDTNENGEYIYIPTHSAVWEYGLYQCYGTDNNGKYWNAYYTNDVTITYGYYSCYGNDKAGEYYGFTILDPSTLTEHAGYYYNCDVRIPTEANVQYGYITVEEENLTYGSIHYCYNQYGSGAYHIPTVFLNNLFDGYQCNFCETNNYCEWRLAEDDVYCSNVKNWMFGGVYQIWDDYRVDRYLGTFENCFHLTGSSATTRDKDGVSIPIYQAWPNAGLYDVAYCYSNSYNLSDYDDMPTMWKWGY